MTPSRVVSAADVPGLSRTLLPTMAMRGIKAIHIGANAAVLPPAFPQVFRWTVPGKEDSAQDDFLVMLYGGKFAISFLFLTPFSLFHGLSFPVLGGVMVVM